MARYDLVLMILSCLHRTCDILPSSHGQVIQAAQKVTQGLKGAAFTLSIIQRRSEVHQRRAFIMTGSQLCVNNCTFAPLKEAY